jgi:hypothetical protein
MPAHATPNKQKRRFQVSEYQIRILTQVGLPTLSGVNAALRSAGFIPLQAREFKDEMTFATGSS